MTSTAAPHAPAPRSIRDAYGQFVGIVEQLAAEQRAALFDAYDGLDGDRRYNHTANRAADLAYDTGRVTDGDMVAGVTGDAAHLGRLAGTPGAYDVALAVLTADLLDDAERDRITGPWLRVARLPRWSRPDRGRAAAPRQRAARDVEYALVADPIAERHAAKRRSRILGTLALMSLATSIGGFGYMSYLLGNALAVGGTAGVYSLAAVSGVLSVAAVALALLLNVARRRPRRPYGGRTSR